MHLTRSSSYLIGTGIRKIGTIVLQKLNFPTQVGSHNNRNHSPTYSTFRYSTFSDNRKGKDTIITSIVITSATTSNQICRQPNKSIDQGAGIPPTSYFPCSLHSNPETHSQLCEEFQRPKSCHPFTPNPMWRYVSSWPTTTTTTETIYQHSVTRKVVWLLLQQYTSSALVPTLLMHNSVSSIRILIASK